MPYKDPEAQKRKMAEVMRQRRAAAKQAKAGDSLPPAEPAAQSEPYLAERPSTPPPATLPKPVSKPRPSQMPAPPAPTAGAKTRLDWNKPTDGAPPPSIYTSFHNRWLTYPDGKGFEKPYENEADPRKQGYGCGKGDGRCCLKLRMLPRESVKVSETVHHCIFRPPYCIYFKTLDGKVLSTGLQFDLFEGKEIEKDVTVN